MKEKVETAQATKRKYQPVWEKIKDKPGVEVRVKAAKTDLLKRIRKGVWKEKDLDDSVVLMKVGDKHITVLFTELWRLTCDIDEKTDILTFKLVPSNHPANV